MIAMETRTIYTQSLMPEKLLYSSSLWIIVGRVLRPQA
jgi:hypothetical protein